MQQWVRFTDLIRGNAYASFLEYLGLNPGRINRMQSATSKSKQNWNLYQKQSNGNNGSYGGLWRRALRNLKNKHASQPSLPHCNKLRFLALTYSFVLWHQPSEAHLSFANLSTWLGFTCTCLDRINFRIHHKANTRRLDTPANRRPKSVGIWNSEAQKSNSSADEFGSTEALSSPVNPVFCIIE